MEGLFEIGMVACAILIALALIAATTQCARCLLGACTRRRRAHQYTTIIGDDTEAPPPVVVRAKDHRTVAAAPPAYDLAAPVDHPYASVWQPTAANQDAAYFAALTAGATPITATAPAPTPDVFYYVRPEKCPIERVYRSHARDMVNACVALGGVPVQDVAVREVPCDSNGATIDVVTCTPFCPLVHPAAPPYFADSPDALPHHYVATRHTVPVLRYMADPPPPSAATDSACKVAAREQQREATLSAFADQMRTFHASRETARVAYSALRDMQDPMRCSEAGGAAAAAWATTVAFSNAAWDKTPAAVRATYPPLQEHKAGTKPLTGWRLGERKITDHSTAPAWGICERDGQCVVRQLYPAFVGMVEKDHTGPCSLCRDMDDGRSRDSEAARVVDSAIARFQSADAAAEAALYKKFRAADAAAHVSRTWRMPTLDADTTPTAAAAAATDAAH